MARVLKGSHSFTCTPTRSSAIGIRPAFAFPAAAGTHLPIPEGLKAELTWVAGYIVRQFTCPKAVIHPTTNRAQCRATTLIETNPLPRNTKQDQIHKTKTKITKPIPRPPEVNKGNWRIQLLSKCPPLLITVVMFHVRRVVFVGGKPGNFPLAGSDLPSHWFV